MPQLLPHTDQQGWVTPTLSEIIETSTPTSFTEEQKRQQINLFRSRLAQLGINADVMDLETLPSHLRFHLRPAGESLSTNQYEIFIGQLREALPEIKKTLVATVGDVMVAPQKPLIVQLLVRTGRHTPLPLDYLLRQQEFVAHESRLALPLGLNVFDETAFTENLISLGTMLVVGEAATRFHLLASGLVSLLLFNTPSELRYALIGQDTDPFAQLAQMPHVLGGTLTNLQEFHRLLDGLVKHLGQRREQFIRHNVADLDSYTAAIQETPQKPFPRLVVIVDSIPFGDDWTQGREHWYGGIHRLVKEGPAVGVHTILTVKSLDPHGLPTPLLDLFGSRVVLRPAVEGVQWTTLPRPMPMSFVGAVFATGTAEPIPLELPELDEKPLVNLTRYWRQMAAKRSMAAMAQGRQQSTGDTGLLTLRQDARLRIQRARQAGQATSAPEPTSPDPVPAPPPVAAPQPQPTETPPVQTLTLDKPQRQAKALAAYLGWLSVGPLVDILELSADEARSVLKVLQETGVLQPGDGPIWNFANPNKRQPQ